ncbi:LmbE family N-acetylglucosaminyl deacetylase [Granulicella aggregans]|uniref:LmbE family N-acetylglucosaminyl deacetylase n=1 Tax=Granulicella aggregans TaxID=474949 RepID=A0A7W8E3J9_9BACT|nr:PIG-L family deacetylase [Granulicella aggregans]MBB5057556.1 LmbE family N-acetylglucosaminyl deacetylase [Granulicella aggregans]
MLVVAHPDDECFGFGGALALAADRGVETYVICLTDGQAATNRGLAASGQELGAMRRAEFAASCKVLGVTHHELLDYQDGRLEFANFPQTTGRIVERIRRFKPDVVLTFGSDGGPNTHADHIMVSMFTTAAFHWAGRPNRYPDLAQPFQPRRLFTVTSSFEIPGRQPPMPSPWTVALDIAAAQDRKSEAFRQHFSQAPLMESTKELFEKYGRQEFYTLLAAESSQAASHMTDLFEGL